MKIYTDIQKASPKSKDGVLQQLALAVALELAIPIPSSNFIDPVKRYLDYEKAYQDGELDPAFAKFDAWELRFVVDGNEQDWVRAWGREMLRNYRPDHILTTSDGGRYAGMVRTNVLYGGGRTNQDRPELAGYQNILMNGGICGRRAFFGRFILRCFGIPSAARPSRAHGALVRWTPKGWIPYLGPRWGSGWTNTIYYSDRNLLASTQARKNKEAFIQVKRAQWAGDVRSEKRQYGGKGDTKSWGGVSLITQQKIIAGLKAVEQAPLDANLAEANDADDGVKDALASANSTNKKSRPLAPGEIAIPVESFKSFVEKSRGTSVMDGYYGGKQLYFGNFGRNGSCVLRGGPSSSDAGSCSSESRIREAGHGGYPDWGFRLAMTPKDGESTPEVKLDLGNGVTIEFVYIKPGSFVMGGDSTTETKYTCSNAPRHEVKITKGYYLAKTELTVAQHAAVLGSKSDKPLVNPNHPVGGAGPDGAERFCMFINDKTGRQVRLPSEAEWEYAARAGTSTKWFFGADPAKLAGPPGSVASQIEYTVSVPQAGKYALTVSVVTMNYHQSINVAVNDDPAETTIKLPFTLGKWMDTEPVVLNLKQGGNVLKFCRKNAPQYGVALNALILKPVQ
ncbi:MAG: SUMF1/EgtB/PvdO family nonheme iron enzyme [Planctomycetales bacterium]|nr:SUMF1/EgtB/PvdO family nonheme iron enzyme [Planctomycetales bacterium]